MERSIYVWNMPRLPVARLALKATLVAIGCETVWVKAGGDDGYAWVPAQPNPPSWLIPQWTDAYAADFRGLRCLPWFYVWPRVAEYDAIVRALQSRMADEIVLNPETEWRVQSDKNPFRNLAAANTFAKSWVAALRASLFAAFGRDFRIGFSGVPSWADFPYEGFAEACDFAHPQHYWHKELMARGEDQVGAHLRRVGKAKPCIPILTVAREYDDAGAFALAETAIRDYPEIQGFSGWVAGDNPFQSEVMRKAYRLLPEEPVEIMTGLPPRSIAFGPYGCHLGGGFRDYYEAAERGGHNPLGIFGYPITEEKTEGGLTVQYFERARFEWHDGGVKLGLVGLELLRGRTG